MAGRVGSLNIATAAAAVLYEAVRQRRGPQTARTEHDCLSPQSGPGPRPLRVLHAPERLDSPGFWNPGPAGIAQG